MWDYQSDFELNWASIELNWVQLNWNLNSIENSESSSTQLPTHLTFIWIELNRVIELKQVFHNIDVIPEVAEKMIQFYGFFDRLRHNFSIWLVQKPDFNHFWAISISKFFKNLYPIELNWVESNWTFNSIEIF